jgi:3-hydroxyisobutyrate dehydrogenase-like beta-hydroxyacid dehydrogenase
VTRNNTIDLSAEIIGFIGLGLMGRPMATNLHRAAARMFIHNRSRQVVTELAAAGMTPAGSPRETAEKALTVILMVSDTKAVTTVCEGEDGLLAGLSPGSTVIDMGTTSVPATKRLAAAAARKGAVWVDAPVSGGMVGAEAGSLSIMVGCPADRFESLLPIFRVLGKNINRVGEVGAGQTTKAANQVIVGITIGAVSEAIHMARRAGVDPARMREALMGGFADSRVLELHGRRMITGDFTPGGKVFTQHKDMREALELAADLSIDLPLTRLTKELYDRLLDRDEGDLDHSALIRLLETEADT